MRIPGAWGGSETREEGITRPAHRASSSPQPHASAADREISRSLRAAIYGYDTFVRNGLSREAFDATRQFLTKYSNILTQTQGARLGYALDSRYYGIGDYNTYVRDGLAKLTVDDVNRAIRQHLSTDRMQIVIVTKDPTPFQDAVAKNTPSPIVYNSPKPKGIMNEDAVIQAYRINVKAEQVTVVPVERVFQ